MFSDLSPLTAQRERIENSRSRHKREGQGVQERAALAAHPSIASLFLFFSFFAIILYWS